ncbi:MAG: hypothetical protein KatS3mg082_3169 [Nitrospiraceae bacterium]|nr:MAG: hypothetical protein KatS3mg082_3169 [Nitrospiraceae bacterium]
MRRFGYWPQVPELAHCLADGCDHALYDAYATRKYDITRDLFVPLVVSVGIVLDGGPEASAILVQGRKALEVPTQRWVPERFAHPHDLARDLVARTLGNTELASCSLRLTAITRSFDLRPFTRIHFVARVPPSVPTARPSDSDLRQVALADEAGVAEVLVQLAGAELGGLLWNMPPAFPVIATLYDVWGPRLGPVLSAAGKVIEPASRQWSDPMEELARSMGW